MIKTSEEFIKIAKDNNKKLYEIALKRELELSKTDEENIYEILFQTIDTMRESANKALDKELKSTGGLLKDEAKKIEEYRRSGQGFLDDLTLSAVSKAFSVAQVNASMGRIAAAPTAGSAGILPGVLFTLEDRLNLDKKDLANGLLTAGLIGEIIATRATISGAEGGCQAECGSATAMAAACIVELSGGGPEEIFNAAAYTLTNILGLVCDPVAGLVEYPCALRNVSGVTNAFLSADLALAYIKPIIPFDEVVKSMYEVGNQMHSSLKETSLGGLAATETGKEIQNKIFN